MTKKQKVSLDLKTEKLDVKTSLRHEFHKVLPDSDVGTQHEGEPEATVDQFVSFEDSNVAN